MAEPVVGTPVLDMVGNTDPLPPEMMSGGIRFVGGTNVDLAQIVAEGTGADIRWPFATTGYADATDLGLAIVLHNFEGIGGAVELSGVNEGVSWKRSIFRSLVHILQLIQAKAVIVKAHRRDRAQCQFLRRLGFVCIGRVSDADDPRLLFRLTLDAALFWRFRLVEGFATWH